jgi:hypothetical protein
VAAKVEDFLSKRKEITEKTADLRKKNIRYGLLF